MPPPAKPKEHPGLADLLQALDPAGRRDRARAIFANRSLRMDLIEVIGFDMDYTLAMYRKEAIEGLAAQATIDKLVARGYPAALRSVEYDSSFVIRGLVVDKRTGNIFKMDKHRHVRRAFHGFQPLDKAARRRVYRAETIRLSATRYHLIDTLFALPEAYLYAAIVDLLERRGPKPVDYARIFQDIRESIDEAHRDGSLKQIILNDIDKYIVSDPGLALTLHKFRSAGKRLFLLTNSYFPYSDALMCHLFDGVLAEYPSWRNYFDFVGVGAAKPAFFARKAPFLLVDRTTGQGHEEVTGALERGKVYQGGNHVALQRSLNAEPDRVLYVGDHIYGDVLRAKKSSAWRTAMIIQEMRAELEVEDRMTEQLKSLVRLEALRVDLDESISHDQTMLRALQRIYEGGLDRYTGVERQALTDAHSRARNALEGDRRSLRQVLEDYAAVTTQVNDSYNSHWGPLFKEGVEHSVFGGQVEDYACLYTSHVSNFLQYSPTRYYRAPRDRMPHERH